MTRASTTKRLDGEALRAAIFDLLEYCPASGVLRWKVDAHHYRARPGREVGSLNNYGYRCLSVGGRPLRAHRVIWLMMTGAWPPCSIDHIDGCRSNNKWENLRLATISQNNSNSKLNSRNTSGFRGVSFDRRNNKWIANICVGGVQKNLGRYSSPVAAAQAYDKAAITAHREFARLNFPLPHQRGARDAAGRNDHT